VQVRLNDLTVQINYYYENIVSLQYRKYVVIEFEEGIGVYYDEIGLYQPYFLYDSYFSCNGLCVKRDCTLEDAPVHFLFIDAIDCARFIVLNILKRTDRITFLLNPNNRGF
jgi:hypothetical protein